MKYEIKGYYYVQKVNLFNKLFHMAYCGCKETFLYNSSERNKNKC